MKIKEPVKAQEFDLSLKVYKELIFMYTKPLVKEKCMNMMIKMLRYWSIGRLHVLKKHAKDSLTFANTKINKTLWTKFLKGRDMLEILNSVDG